MSESRGTLESIALTLGRLFEPLEQRMVGGQVGVLFAELGLQFPPALHGISAVNSSAQRLGDALALMRQSAEELTSAIDADDTAQAVAKSIELTTALAKTIVEIKNLSTALRNTGGASGLPAAEVTAFADALPGRLVDYLVSRKLEAAPGLAEGFQFIGALEREWRNVESLDPARPPYVYRELHLNALTDFIQSPADHFESLYGFGTSSFDGQALLSVLESMLQFQNVPAILDDSGSLPVLDVFAVELSPKIDVSPRGLSIRLVDPIRFAGGTVQQEGWRVDIAAEVQAATGTEMIIQPGDEITVIPTLGDVKGDICLTWTAARPDGEPQVLIGQAGGSRIEAGEIIARAGGGFRWNSSTNKATGELILGAEIKEGKVVISLEGADGFIGTLLSGVGVESEFDAGFGFSTVDGLHFHGSSTLEIQIPLHVNLGPFNIDALTLSFGFEGASFPMGLAVDFTALLGPLTVVIQGIGAEVTLSLPANRDGNAGPVDFAFGFKPPKGVGLSIDAGVIVGGGYLFFDFEREEYAGALELTFSGFLSLKAIGLITTRMPDGSKGFSLLVIITAEFGSGIQLGYGFVLLGCGGLLGLNRTMKLQPLMEGVRTGAVNNIMFPTNPVENAPRIISDLRTIFPAANGIFLIGPMAKLGWGIPALITVSLGVIIEIPGNIAILGVIKVALPEERVAILQLQVNFAGAIEFDKSRLYFFAALFDSRVLFITLEGEMGLLVAWGLDANFVLSVGGFHPLYDPPPLPFPNPVRILVAILNTSAARILSMGYFGVTSNSVQFGTRTELYFGFSAINISGHIAFDALFRFSPFYFIIQTSASVSLKVFGMGLFSIRLKFSLEGPTPWRAKGSGSISFLFFSVEADFDISWGESRDTSLPPIEVMPLLEAELNKLENWTAEVPSSNRLLVSLRILDTTEELVLHPVGVLRVSQRAVPLDITIDKVGNSKAQDANRFALAVPSGGLGEHADAREAFAIGQYQDIDDTAKLTRPAFQDLNSGLELSAAGQQSNSARLVKRIVRYEVHTIDTFYKRNRKRFQIIIGKLFAHFLKNNAASKSPLSFKSRMQVQPFDEKIVVNPDPFTVAFTDTNTAMTGQAGQFDSEAEAREYMNDVILTDPSLAGKVHVIPQAELAA